MWNTTVVESTLCKCGKPRRKGGRYCVACHAKHMQIWRKSHPLTKLQRKKNNCRSYAHVYRDRGKLKMQPCLVCGSLDVEMHHPDYDKPLQVVWFCRQHHLELHRGTIAVEQSLTSRQFSPTFPIA